MSLSPEKEALKRIEECRRSRAGVLDLSHLGLVDIPKEAFQLTWLQELNLSFNQRLNNFCFLERYPKLQSLACISNRLSDLAFLQYVPQLQSLFCGQNQLNDLSGLQHVSKLRVLDCYYCHISDLTFLQHVSNLQSLECGNNEFDGLRELEHTPNLHLLDCRYNQIGDLSYLRHVRQLRSLNCSETNINNLSQLGHVPNLESLECGNNKLKDLSQLKYVPNLQLLAVHGNQIESLEPLKYVPKLQELNLNQIQSNDLSKLEYVPQLKALQCGSNQISSLSALKHVPLLQTLYCGDNNLSDMNSLKYVPELNSLNCCKNRLSGLNDLENVPKLQALTCWSNQIADLNGLRYVPSIQSVDCALNHLCNVRQLYKCVMSGQIKNLQLWGNSVEGIPHIVFGDATDDCVESLRNYWLDLQKSSTCKNQLKVQFVGNGRVGKTTLAYALEHEKGPCENFKSTHGITIKEISQVLESGSDSATLQLWDFGGQEIYHATHRLFLGDNCLYLLLWAEYTEENLDETRHPVSYWLELIHDLAPNSPIILIKNQVDRVDTLPARPPELVNADLPGVKQIRQDVKISAMQYRGIKSLKAHIEEVIDELKYRVCLELPTSWLQVEKGIKQINQKTIPFAHFQQLCIKAGVSDAKWLANYLHKTGVLFYREGTFQDQVILDQNWVIEAVYRLFDPKDKKHLIERMQGSFKGTDTEIFWPEASNTEREIYLGFMSDCCICYQPNHHAWVKKPFAERDFIIPSLLPKTSHAQIFWCINEKDDWLLEVDFPFLHRSIIERLIVKLGENSQTSNPWRYGIGCETEHGNVLMECQYENTAISNKGRLLFHLRGSQLEQLLYNIRKLVKKVSPHSRYQEYLTKAGIKETLEAFVEREASGNHSTQSKTMNKTVKLFISYSHVDESHKDELEICLKNIKRRCPQLEYWEDRQMFAGEPVDEQILTRLEAADIVVLLISRNFFASDYCFTIEMEKALKRYVEKENILTPIIIRTTADWNDFDIGKITVLPKDGLPLNDWSDEDKFWESVQIGIRRQVERLTELRE